MRSVYAWGLLHSSNRVLHKLLHSSNPVAPFEQPLSVNRPISDLFLHRDDRRGPNPLTEGRMNDQPHDHRGRLDQKLPDLRPAHSARPADLPAMRRPAGQVRTRPRTGGDGMSWLVETTIVIWAFILEVAPFFWCLRRTHPAHPRGGSQIASGGGPESPAGQAMRAALRAFGAPTRAGFRCILSVLGGMISSPQGRSASAIPPRERRARHGTEDDAAEPATSELQSSDETRHGTRGLYLTGMVMADPTGVTRAPLYLTAAQVDQLIASGSWQSGVLDQISVSPPRSAWPSRWHHLKGN